MTDGNLNLCLVSVLSYVGPEDKTEELAINNDPQARKG